MYHFHEIGLQNIPSHTNYCRLWVATLNISCLSTEYLFNILTVLQMQNVDSHHRASAPPQLPLRGCSSTEPSASASALEKSVFRWITNYREKRFFKSTFFLNISLQKECLPFYPKSWKHPPNINELSFCCACEMKQLFLSSLHRRNLRHRLPAGTH